MSIPASLLQHAEAHPCFSGCYGSDPDVSLCLDPARPLAPMLVVSCQDCFARLGVPRSLLPSGATSTWLAGQMTQHLRKQRGYGLSFSGYHTKGPGFWLSVAYYSACGLFLINGERPGAGGRPRPAHPGVPSWRRRPARPAHARPPPVHDPGSLRPLHRADGPRGDAAGAGHVAALSHPTRRRLPARHAGGVPARGSHHRAGPRREGRGQRQSQPASGRATSAPSAAPSTACARCSRGRTSAACVKKRFQSPERGRPARRICGQDGRAPRF